LLTVAGRAAAGAGFIVCSPLEEIAMRKTPVVLLALTVLVATGCPNKGPAKPSGDGPPPASGPSIAPPAAGPYAYRESTLDNGLRIVTLEDHSTPIAAVQLWYHVGSKDEKPNRRGFAHMFEHMMFRGTENIGPKAHFEHIRKVGGTTNAYTSFDNTTYIQTVPSNQVEMVFWLEAERMGFLKINQGYFDTERFVVAEEYRRGREQPYGKVIDEVLPKIFTEHPYRWSPIGDMDELAEARAGELQEFWNTYYVPNNATLVVVGDIDHEQVHRLADRYFGWIPRYPDPPRVTAREPAQTGKRTITVKTDNGPAPVVGLLYRTVPKGHPDELALEMLAQIVGQGESSRIYRDLVSERKLAKFALSLAFTLEQDGLFAVGGVLSPLGGKPDQAVAAMREHIAAVKRDGVTAAELEKAKNNMLRDAVAGQLTIESKAQLLGEAAVIRNDLASVNRRFDDIRALTSADLQRVARTYLVDAHENEVRIEPNLLGMLAGGGKSDGEKAPEKPADSGEISGGGAGKPDLERPDWMAAKPPVAAADPRFAKTAPVTRKLANGLDLVVVPNREVPFMTMAFGVRYGARHDPSDRPGTASMAASMLTRGTRDKSYNQLTDELDRYAVTIAGSASMDGLVVTASSVTDQRERAMRLLAEVVTRPTFPEDQLEELVGQTKTGMIIAHAAPEYIADRELRRRVFGSHPYARTETGEVADLDALTAAGLRAWWSGHVRPDTAVLYVAGDVDPDEIEKLAAASFGGWKVDGEPPAHAEHGVPAPVPTRIYLIDRPSDQAQIRVGHLGIAQPDPRYIRARVMGEVLGGGFNARLNDRIRVKEGLTYGARGGFRGWLQSGLFTVSTFSKNATVGKTVEAILDELRLMTERPVTPTELSGVVGYMVGSFARLRETPESLVSDLWKIRLYGLPADYYERYLAEVAKVTPAQVTAAAAEMIQRDRLVIVVVGKADELAPQLESIAPVERVGAD
jgi:zinc protease